MENAPQLKQDLFTAIAEEMFGENVRKALKWADVSRLGFQTQLDRLDFPVAAAYRPNSRSVTVHHGKGLTDKLAIASAVGEALEIAHAEAIDLPLEQSSYASLAARDDVLNPDKLLQMRGMAFDGSRHIEWLSARTLISGSPVFVPLDSVSLDTTRSADICDPSLVASSSGMGAGKTFNEALQHGLCEVIERDAHTLWKLKPSTSQDRCRIDLKTIKNSVFAELLKRCEEQQVFVACWNVTSDIGVPVFLTALLERDSQSPVFVPYALGSGCHPDPDTALLKAFSEALQMRLLQITSVRDDLVAGDYALQNLDVWRSKLAELTNQAPAVAWDNTPVNSSFSSFMDHLISRFMELNLDDPLVLDLTRPDLQIPVVKVLAPGFEDAIEGVDQKLGDRAMAALMGAE